MSIIVGLNTEKLVKTAVILGLEDVLVSGKIDPSIDSKSVQTILENLQKVEKKVKGFHFFLVTGYTKEKVIPLLEKAGLKDFFDEKHLFFVTKEYIDSKEEVDRKLHETELEKDPFFKDEYFKQVTVDKISEELNIPKQKMILIGHDLWFTGFYTMRFSKIDFALIRSALSNRGKPQQEIIKGLTYFNRTWVDFRKLLTGSFPVSNNAFLDRYIQEFLKKELLGEKGINSLVAARKKQLEERNA
ncbi:hypothetical protein KKE06_05130 [Candidatus Micrarchaeota archaeon]|nr:hypothetical protein [Candidatus Micrarchaeota archaeon]MBU1930220.1 hypothetical protein [Candidatus Micrarchaeota archaeon]